jgi:hypothetical protein
MMNDGYGGKEDWLEATTAFATTCESLIFSIYSSVQEVGTVAIYGSSSHRL